jgi:hypothetical protein
VGHGGIYVYQRNQGGSDAWGELRIIEGTGMFSSLGSSLAVWNGRLIAGAPMDDQAALDGGAAHIFDPVPDPAVFADGFESGDTGKWSHVQP